MRLHPPSLLWPGAVICWTRCVLECFDLSIPHSRSSQISVLICTKTRGQSHAAPTEHSMQGLYSCGNVSIITAVVGVGCIQLCQVFATMCDSHLPSMYVCVCVCVMSTLRISYSIYLFFLPCIAKLWLLHVYMYVCNQEYIMYMYSWCNFAMLFVVHVHVHVCNSLYSQSRCPKVQNWLWRG